MWVLNYDEKCSFLLNENIFYLDFGSSVDKRFCFLCVCVCCSFKEKGIYMLNWGLCIALILFH